MKSIGGYFDLELHPGNEYYPELIKLNTGRNSLELILKLKGYTSIYIPYFSCDVILEPIKKLGLQYRFYTIDDKLDPILDFELSQTECLLYINYFGLKIDTVLFLREKYSNLIIDNSQAFFSEPLGIDAFYSCRKFFGVSDGAYLHIINPVKFKLERDQSFKRSLTLIKSVDVGAENCYEDFVGNERSLSNAPIKKMSVLTQRILAGIDYKMCKYRRNANFMYLHDFLVNHNNLVIDIGGINGPMAYPLLQGSSVIITKLKEKKVYPNAYWSNVLDWTTKKMFENYLATHLVALPIDHRYNHTDMKRLINILKPLL